MSHPSIPAIPNLVMQSNDSAKDVRQLLSLLEKTARQTLDVRRAQQEAHLAGLLRLASHAVPRQRERLPNWCREGTFSWRRFSELPLCTRADLQEAGTTWHHPSPPPAFRPLGKTSTSGSTGAPLITWGHKAAGLLKDALQLRMQRRLGFDFDRTCAFLTTPHPPGVADPPHGKKGRRWAPAVGAGEGISLTLLASSEDQLDWLIRNDPPYLASYPSNLLALLQLSQSQGRAPRAINKIVLSSEPITDELTRFAKELWNAECARTYSASETGLIASQIPGKDEYYVEAENVLLELLREDGTPCGPGEVGRVVVTTLQDFLRPLIRYEVGDYAEWAEPCPDDPVTLPRLRRIAGRERTMIRLPDGRRIWPHFEFTPLMAIGGLRQWQLVQGRDDSLKVRVVTEGPLNTQLSQAIAKVVEEALPGLCMQIVSVDHIERTRGGKFMEVVRED